jgi:urease accessory protein
MSKRTAWFFPAALLASGAAFAHGGDASHAHGFAAGFAHPLGGVDHLLAMVGVGLFAAVLGGRARWVLPSAFLTAMVVGALGGLAGIGNGAPVEQLIALSVMAIGLPLALAARPPLAWATALVSVCALFHGQAHGAELPAGAGAATYIVGFVFATAMLHGAGLTLGLALQSAARQRFAPVARIAGSTITLAGLVLVTAV